MKHWSDALTTGLFPRWTLRRQRARLAGEILQRHYEAAASGRRTSGWNRASGDANAAVGSGLARTREVARDLVRNNPFAESALATITDHVVGWGISADDGPSWWPSWAETTACDADGRQDLYGLQTSVMGTVAVAGECLVRRRWRRPQDGLPIPMQLQVLEPDFLDSSRDGAAPGGGRIIQGKEYDGIGRLRQYWLFRDHPGSNLAATGFGASVPIPASEILHVFKPGRPGQVRGMSWFAPVILRLKDFDDYEDAALMKQKIAACLAVITSDIDGTSPALGTTTTEAPGIDMLEPGGIHNVPPGRSVTVVDPPSVSEHDAYSRTVLRAIAAGMGISYEDMTGDFQNLPFSAARMSGLRHWARVHSWRWKMLIPQFCDPVWAWSMEAAAVVNLPTKATTEWTAPPAPMVDPGTEGLAAQRNIRAGISTLFEEIRLRGFHPEKHVRRMAKEWELVHKLGLILDSDASLTTQAGLPRDTAKPADTDDTPNDETSAARMGARNGHGAHA